MLSCLSLFMLFDLMGNEINWVLCHLQITTALVEYLIVLLRSICICMLRGSTHYCAIAPRVLSHHIVDFLGSRRMETAPTSIEVLLRPTLV